MSRTALLEPRSMIWYWIIAEFCLLFSSIPKLYTCIQKFSFCDRWKDTGIVGFDVTAGNSFVLPITKFPAPISFDGTSSIRLARISDEADNLSSSYFGTLIAWAQTPR